MALLDELKADAGEFGVTMGILFSLVAGLWLWQKGTWAIIMVALLIGAVYVLFMLKRR